MGSSRGKYTLTAVTLVSLHEVTRYGPAPRTGQFPESTCLFARETDQHPVSYAVRVVICSAIVAFIVPALSLPYTLEGSFPSRRQSEH